MRIHLAAVLSAALAIGPASQAFSNEFEGPLRDLAAAELTAWTQAPELLEAIRAQNAAHAGLTQAQIDALDQTWRAEIGSSATPMISEVMSKPGSRWLQARKEESSGLLSEVFVTDALGLNVAQSDVTSDYWQGDEAKFTEVYDKGSDTVLVSEVELDESTQSYQSQVSLPIMDPDTGDAIGTITFGVNVEYLQ